MIKADPQEGKLNDRFKIIISNPKSSFESAKASFIENPLILVIDASKKDNTYVFTFEPIVSGQLVLSVNGQTIKIHVDSQKAIPLSPMRPLSFEATVPFEISQENEIYLNEIALNQPQLNVDIVSSKTFPLLPLMGLLLIGALLPLIVFYLKGKKKVLPPKEEALETLKTMQNKAYKSPQDLYEDLSSVVRNYLERTTKLPVTRLTTEEFFKAAALDPDLNRATLDFFLIEADKVKFAKKTPSPKEINAAVQAAKQIIR